MTQATHDNEVHDYTSVESGALPSLDGEATTEVLGEPTSKTKAKSNVTKLFHLLLVLLAFVLIIAGLLWFMKSRNAKPMHAQSAAAAKAAEAQKNAALENASLERTKKELKERQAQEEAAAKAAKEAERERDRAAQPVQQQPSQQLGPQPAAQGNAKAAPPPPTPEERRMSGDVLVSLTTTMPTRTSTPAAAPAGGFGSTQAQGGEGLAAHLKPTVFEARSAGNLPNLDYLLKRGTTIPCALKTGIDTTLPGIVVCNALSDVYSANGKTLLVERGASVFGEQQSSLKQGQERTFVVWTRIDNPSGVFANIDSPAVDQMGYSGVPGYVDTHFWKRFGGAIMLSLIQDFSQALANRQRDSMNSGPTYNNSQQAAQDMASEALRNSINIPPTLYVRPATVVNVMVARDVSFENVYALVK